MPCALESLAGDPGGERRAAASGATRKTWELQWLLKPEEWEDALMR